MAGREEEGRLLPGGTWVWEGSGDGRWLHTPWSRLASLHRCNSSIRVSETISIRVSETIFSVVQRSEVQLCAFRLLLFAHVVSLFFRLSPLALKSYSCMCPSSLAAPTSCSPSQRLTIFFSFVTPLYLIFFLYP